MDYSEAGAGQSAAPGHGGAPTGIERRTSRLAYAFWFQMAKGRRFPSLDDLDLDAAGDLRNSFFFLSAAREAADCIVIEAGRALADALGRDPTRSPFGRTLPDGARRRMLEALQYVLDIGNPMEEQGSFSRNGQEVLYRLVFLPLADDHHSISHVLGAFSFRLNIAV
jgi:hypothetical protein